LPKGKSESQRHPPAAKVLEGYAPEVDPWNELRNKPGIKIISTARGSPDEVAWTVRSSFGRMIKGFLPFIVLAQQKIRGGMPFTLFSARKRHSW